MNSDLLNTIILAGAFLMLFVFAEILYHRYKVHAEITRKIVHIFTGILTLLFPHLISVHWYILFLCGSFLLILILSRPLKMLPSINNVGRVTQGSILYPIVVYVCFLLFQHENNLLYFYLPILILALCDPMAALIGKNYPWGKYSTFGNQKTLSGSFAFFLTGLVLSAILLVNLGDISIVSALLIATFLALVTTLAESFSHGGFDNLTIPMSALGILYLLDINGFLG